MSKNQIFPNEILYMIFKLRTELILNGSLYSKWCLKQKIKTWNIIHNQLKKEVNIYNHDDKRNHYSPIYRMSTIYNFDHRYNRLGWLRPDDFEEPRWELYWRQEKLMGNILTWKCKNGFLRCYSFKDQYFIRSSK